MSAILLPANSKRKRKIHPLKIDMTPMVDLGFLLITFFIFTATLSQPAITRLIMPKEGVPTPVAQSKALTILLDHLKAFAYEGRWEDATAGNRIIATGYDLQNGIGNIIRQKQKMLLAKDDLVVVIKPLQASSYQQVITVLDEMQINNVKKYSLADATAEERLFAAHKQ